MSSHWKLGGLPLLLHRRQDLRSWGSAHEVALRYADPLRRPRWRNGQPYLDHSAGADSNTLWEECAIRRLEIGVSVV